MKVADRQDADKMHAATTLADLIAPGSGRVRIHFPDESKSVDYGLIWKMGEAMGCLRAKCEGRPVAVASSNTSACVAVLVGAIASGLPILSVPMPPRGSDLNWYSAFVRRICAASGASTFLVDASLVPLLPVIEGISFLSFNDALSISGPHDSDPASFTITQFTSGSTADPRGVRLLGPELVANLLALMDWLQPTAADGTCTWLPLSHDMGLIGMFLGSLVGAGEEWARGGDLVIMTPQSFLRNPTDWLRACEEFGSTITAAPSHGYDTASRRCVGVNDLRNLRVCIVGGEPILAGSLERFSDVFHGAGFDSVAFCPAYGMAEAALAVTATPPDVHWHAAQAAEDSDDASTQVGNIQAGQVVSSGAPLRGYEVRTDGIGVGEIFVRGPSIAKEYADGTCIRDANGWFNTHDVGVLRNGELYVFGRTDDVFQVAGRNVHALDIEVFAGDVAGIRTGRTIAVPEDGSFTIVAECEPAITAQDDRYRVARAVRQRVVIRLGVAPRRVLLVQRGTLPFTASGKPRRAPLRAALLARQLDRLSGSIQ
jgi:fatty-acyl-CoA synthase